MHYLEAMIKDAILEYSQSGLEINVTRQVIRKGNKKVSPSALGYCPTQKAYQREGRPSDYPEADLDATANSLMVAQMGNIVAGHYQAALLHYAAQRHWVTVEVEPEIEDNKVLGYADVIFGIDDYEADYQHKTLVDFKFRVGAKGGADEPHEGDAYQLLSYAQAIDGFDTFNGDEMYIVVIGAKVGTGTPEPFTVYHLKPVFNGFMFYDTTTDDAVSGFFANRWNNPETLNFDTVNQLIDEHAAVLVAEEKPVIPKGSDRYWMCWNNKTSSPRCPWFKTCHEQPTEELDF